jgi:hypothetical protein
MLFEAHISAFSKHFSGAPALSLSDELQKVLLNSIASIFYGL